MLEAVRRPGQSLEAFLVDRPAVDDTTTKRPVVESLQCVSHLLQHGGIELSVSERLVFRFSGDACVCNIARRIQNLRTRILLFPRHPG